MHEQTYDHSLSTPNQDMSSSEVTVVLNQESGYDSPNQPTYPNVDTLRSIFNANLRERRSVLLSKIALIGGRIPVKENQQFRYRAASKYLDRTIDTTTVKKIAVLDGFKLSELFVDMVNESCSLIGSDFKFLLTPTKTLIEGVDSLDLVEFNKHEHFRQFIAFYQPLLNDFYSYLQKELFPTVRLITCNLLVDYARDGYKFAFDGKPLLKTGITKLTIEGGDRKVASDTKLLSKEMGLLGDMYGNGSQDEGVQLLFAEGVSRIGKINNRKLPVPRNFIFNHKYCYLLAALAVSHVSGHNFTVPFEGVEYGYAQMADLGRAVVRESLRRTYDPLAVGTYNHMCVNVSTAFAAASNSIPSEYQEGLTRLSNDVVPNLMCMVQEELMAVYLDANTGELSAMALDGIFGTVFATLVWERLNNKVINIFDYNDIPVVQAILSGMLAPIGMPDGLIEYVDTTTIHINSDLLMENDEWFLNPFTATGILLMTSVVNAHDNDLMWIGERISQTMVANYKLAETIFNLKDTIKYIPPVIKFTEHFIDEANALLSKCIDDVPFVINSQNQYNRVVGYIKHYCADKQLDVYKSVDGSAPKIVRAGRKDTRKVSDRTLLKEDLYNWLIINSKYNPLYPIKWVATNSAARAEEIRKGLNLPERFASLKNETVRRVYCTVQTEMQVDMSKWVDGWDFRAILMEGEQHYVDIAGTREREAMYVNQKSRYEHYVATGEVLRVDVENVKKMAENQRTNNQALKMKVTGLENRVAKLEAIIAKLGVDL